MKRIYKGLGIMAVLLMAGCTGMEPIVLEPRDDIAYKPSDYKGVVLSDGALYDFRGGLGDWWWDKKYTILKQGSAMKIMCKGPGAGYEPFGINFDATDFSNAPVIRIRMKLDEKTQALPVIRLDLKDINGFMTNGSAPSNTIRKSDDWVEYYFDYNHKWKQAWPEPAEVDPTKIVGMQFFVNPGGKSYMGTIIMDEIYAMANKDGSGVVSSDIVIDDFNGGLDLWWPCKEEKVKITKHAEEPAAVVHIEDGQWECFGKIFGDVDITNNAIIRIRARAESNTPVKSTNTMARFIDINENSTDLIDGDNMSELEVGGADYNYYFSSFLNDNLYSSTGDFDPEHVNRVIIFFNMNKEANFTGDIIMDEVAFVAELPKEEQKRRANVWGARPSMDPSWNLGSITGALSDLQNSANWKSSTDKLSVSGSGELKISSKGAGPFWDKLTGSLSKGANVYANPYIKITAKASGSVDPEIRLQMVDDRGKTANGRPQLFTVNAGSDYQDYYVNMSNNLYQRYPTLDIVNGQSIKELELFVNGGLTGYTGEISIKEISLVSDNDLPEEWFEKLKTR